MLHVLSCLHLSCWYRQASENPSRSTEISAVAIDRGVVELVAASQTNPRLAENFRE